ncbi:CPBP family intramembrane metalloprotease [Christensenellaceae bacterium OttesenSCG-928-L17]|nr:CPBP family intramembrane metalloprotease [Christensenellaceae bacterium OttesenSCG-928-L17]
MDIQNPKKVFSRIALSAAVQMLLYQLLATVAITCVYAFAPLHIAQAKWMVWVCNYVPYYGIAIPAMLIILRAIPDTEQWQLEKRRIGAKHFVLLLLVCWGISGALGVVSNLITLIIETLKGAPLGSTQSKELMMEQPWLYFFVAVICAPIVEEYVFRYVLYKKLARYGGKVYVLFSAFLFAMCHANIGQLFYAFVIGLVLAAVYYFSGNIRHTIALHMAFNFVGGSVAIFLLHYAGVGMVAAWSLVALGCMTAGCIIGVSWWKKHKQDLYFRPGEMAATRQDMFKNSGTIFFIVIIVAIMLLGIVA